MGNVKTVSGLAVASVKTINSKAIAGVKTRNGLPFAGGSDIVSNLEVLLTFEDDISGGFYYVQNFSSINPNGSFLHNNGDGVIQTSGAKIGSQCYEVGSSSTGHLIIDNTNQPNFLNPNGSGDQTIACWIKPRVSTSDYQMLYAVIGVDADNVIYLALDPSMQPISFWRDSAGNSAVPNSASALSTGTWYHYMVVKLGTTVKIYIDNAEVATATNGSIGAIDVSGTPSGSSMRLGIYADGINYPFKGRIDDFRIYSRALSSDDRTALFNHT